MINEIKNKTKIKMDKCVENFKKNINSIFYGKGYLNIVSNILINCYNKKVKLKHLGSIIIKNNTSLSITLFDNSISDFVIKSIINSDIGLNPLKFNNNIIVNLPKFSSEKIKGIIKNIKKESENSKIMIRHIRRDVNNKTKIYSKDKIISKDEEIRINKYIQKITSIYTKEIDSILINKEKELESLI